MVINFYPESDKEGYIKATAEYMEIWMKDGQKIIDQIEKTSKLKFKTNIINAVIFDGISYSYPLRLCSSYSKSHKKATLIHELCHRLLMDNSFYLYDTKNLSEDVHKIIYLILFDLWVSLIGQTAAKESRQIEISYGDDAYKNAWNWALSFNSQERQTKFKELTTKYSNYKSA